MTTLFQARLLTTLFQASLLPWTFREFVSRFFSKMVHSAAVTDGFIRDTEEVNARISPTRIAIDQSSSHVYLVQVLKRESVFMSALCTLHRE